MATNELAAKLQKRNNIIDQAEEGLEPDLPSMKVFNPYTEFKEFSRKEIQNFQKMFNEYVCHSMRTVFCLSVRFLF